MDEPWERNNNFLFKDLHVVVAKKYDIFLFNMILNQFGLFNIASLITLFDLNFEEDKIILHIQKYLDPWFFKIR